MVKAPKINSRIKKNHLIAYLATGNKINGMSVKDFYYIKRKAEKFNFII